MVEFPRTLSDADFELRCKEWKLMGYEILKRGPDVLVGSGKNEHNNGIIYGGWKEYTIYVPRDGCWHWDEQKYPDGHVSFGSSIATLYGEE